MRICLLAFAIAAGLTGCSPAEPEATKDDFAKKPMPSNFHGPETTPTRAVPPAAVRPAGVGGQ